MRLALTLVIVEVKIGEGGRDRRGGGRSY